MGEGFHGPREGAGRFSPPDLLGRLVEETADEFVSRSGSSRLSDCAADVIERNRRTLDALTPVGHRLNLHLTVGGMAIDVLTRGRALPSGLESLA